MSKYAENTSVSVNKTETDIKSLILKHGADQFLTGVKGNRAVIGFVLEGRHIRICFDLPDKSSKEFLYTPERRTKRSDEAAYTAWEQACRQKWREVHAIIKAKFIAVEGKISTVEKEFFYDILLPDGRTVGEFMAPQLEIAYETGNMPALLPMLN